MKLMTFKRCVTDDELAQASLFFMENRRDIHASYAAIDSIEMLYTFMTQGHLIQVKDASQQIIALAAYYHGTPEHDFQDKHAAFIEMAVAGRAHRGTRLFLEGLQFMADDISNNYPEVSEVQLAALSSNVYLCNLYAKFADTSFEDDSVLGKQMKFSVKIHNLKAFLDKFKRL